MKSDRKFIVVACGFWLVGAAIAADPALDQARSAYLAKDYAAAAASLEGFVANNPGHPGLEEARHTLAASYDALGRYADAARAYRDLLKQHPLTAHAEKARFQLAHAEREKRDWDEAINVYRDYLERYPAADRRIEAEWEIAQCLFEARRYDELATYAGQLFSENPEHPQRSEWIFLEGRILQDAGDFSAAIDKYLEYLTAENSEENDKQALLFLAKAMRAQGSALGAGDAPTSSTTELTAAFLSEQEIAYLRILLDHPDQNPDDRAWAFFMSGEFAELERLAAEFLADHRPRDCQWLAMQLWLGIGQLYKTPPDEEAAAATFDAIIAVEAASIIDHTPEFAAEQISRAADWRINIARRSNDEKTIRRIRNRLEFEVPDNNVKTDLLKKYSRLTTAKDYLDRGLHADAIRELTHIIENHPRDIEIADARLLLARSHDQLNDFQAALEAYQEVLRLHPDHEKAAFIHYVIARKYDDLEQRETAIERYQAFVADYPSHEDVPNAHYYAARNLEKLERWPEAAEKYRLFIEQYPESNHAGEARAQLEACLAHVGQ